MLQAFPSLGNVNSGRLNKVGASAVSYSRGKQQEQSPGKRPMPGGGPLGGWQASAVLAVAPLGKWTFGMDNRGAAGGTTPGGGRCTGNLGLHNRDRREPTITKENHQI